VPLIERLLLLARDAEASEVCCIVNEGMPEVKRFLTAGSFGVPLRLMVRRTPSSLHSLHALAPLLAGEPFCLLTADSVFRADELHFFLAAARRQGAPAGVLAVTDYVHDDKPLYVRADTARRILAFPEEGEERWVTGGVYAFSPAVLPDVERAVRDGIVHLRNALRFLLQQGHVLEAHPFSRMIDVDRLSDVGPAEELLAAEARR
jgi:NDP-sugar pyrophosphorylase family protein